MYDVFLSHNRRDKPWVRALHRYMVARGLSVFFDEEDVMPGQNIVAAIENALEQSRRVLLVLSPGSLASKWVALETQLSIHADPDASDNRVVPVLVEKVNWQNVRPTIRTLNCVDLTDPSSRETGLIRVLASLGISSVDRADLDALLACLETKPAVQPLSVAGVNEVFDWGWSGVKLLDEFIALDYATLDELVPSHEGSPRQWAPVFMNHPETWRMLVSAPMEIRGYWHFAPLFSDDYQLAKEGQLLDSKITADRIRLFELPGEYEIYFVQLCLHPRFRHPTHVRQLFRSILDVFEELSDQGIYVKELCANAYSEAGASICRSFNLKRLCEHSEHGTIFGAPISEVLKSTFGSSHRRLHQAYKDAGLA